MVAAVDLGGLPLSLLLVVVVVRRQLNPVTAAGFDGSSVVVGSFWCSGVGISGSLFHIKVSRVSGNLYRSLWNQRGLIQVLAAAEATHFDGSCLSF